MEVFMNFRIFSGLLFCALLALSTNVVFSMDQLIFTALTGPGFYTDALEDGQLITKRLKDCTHLKACECLKVCKHLKLKEQRILKKAAIENALRDSNSGPDGKSPLRGLLGDTLKQFASITESGGLLEAITALERSFVAPDNSLVDTEGTIADGVNFVNNDEKEEKKEAVSVPVTPTAIHEPEVTIPDGEGERKTPAPREAGAGISGSKRSRVARGEARQVAGKRYKVSAGTKAGPKKKGSGHKTRVTLSAECTSCEEWYELTLSSKGAEAVGADSYWLCKACACWLTCSEPKCGCMHKISRAHLEMHQAKNIDFSEHFVCKQNTWNRRHPGVIKAIAACANKK